MCFDRQARDGNNDSIVHDNLPPSSESISIDSGNEYTTSSSVTLSLAADGADQMYVTNSASCLSGGVWEAFDSSKSWTLAHTNSSTITYVKFKDFAGNESSCVSDSIIHDGSGPTGVSLTIDGGNDYTSSGSVSLTLAATDAQDMYITNSAGCSAGGSWQTFTASRSWTLAQSNSLAKVYVKFRDQAGNESSCIDDTITHDDTAPTVTSFAIEGGNGYVNTTGVSLNLDVSGAHEMYVTNTAGCSADGTWQTYATSRSWTLAQTNGSATVYAKFRDEAGNESSCVDDSITHDSVAPSGESISIESGAAYVTTATVSLGLAATDADEMYVTNTSGCSGGGSWEAYSTSDTWTLGQNNTTATVYVKFRDLAGNETSCTDDSILHDDTPPSSADIDIDSSAEYTTSTSVSLALTASDASEMYVTDDSGCSSGGSWEAYTTSKAWTLSGTNGVIKVYVKYRDTRGNETGCIDDSITHDDTIPAAPSGVFDAGYPIVSWYPATEAGSGIDYYEVSVGISAGDTSVSDWSNIGSDRTVEMVDLGLSLGSTYYVNVRAVDLSGHVGAVASSPGFVHDACKASQGSGSWVLVPGDADYGTADFCVMKFEAKDVSGSPSSLRTDTPWNYIKQADARTECASLGAGYHLITNPEWMTIASNAANVDSNWTGGSVGTGQLFRGHTDSYPNELCRAHYDDLRSYVYENSCAGQVLEAGKNAHQRRTHTLSNGSIIWDLSGNAYELVDYFNKDDKPGPGGHYFSELDVLTSTPTTNLADLIPTNAVKSFWNDSWNSAQSIGMYYRGVNGSAGVMLRSGVYDRDVEAGIFYADFGIGSNDTRYDTGFRCVYTIP